MDIGTAKPSRAELDSVPHHLIDILSPSESFSAGLFREKATDIINNLHNNKKMPVIVGGTGLYIRSLTRGLFEGPGADSTLRKQLQEEEENCGRGHLYNKLTSIDPDAAEQIESGDLRRVIRALEVSLKGHKKISDCRRISTTPANHDFIKIGLTRDRKELYRMIENRIDKMMEVGLLKETENLLKMHPKKTALQALGYKEMALYLDGAADLDEAVRLTKKRTKMYAKRQYTWFKKEPDINWVDITGITNTEHAFAKVINDVEIMKKLIYSNVN
jgi:tRNA dimethylallyltransferase